MEEITYSCTHSSATLIVYIRNSSRYFIHIHTVTKFSPKWANVTYKIKFHSYLLDFLHVSFILSLIHTSIIRTFNRLSSIKMSCNLEFDTLRFSFNFEFDDVPSFASLSSRRSNLTYDQIKINRVLLSCYQTPATDGQLEAISLSGRINRCKKGLRAGGQKREPNKSESHSTMTFFLPVVLQGSICPITYRESLLQRTDLRCVGDKRQVHYVKAFRLSITVIHSRPMRLHKAQRCNKLNIESQTGSRIKPCSSLPLRSVDRY